MVHVRGTRSRLGRLVGGRLPVVGAAHRWTTFAAAASTARELAAALHVTVAHVDSTPAAATLVFDAHDGWQAKVRIDLEEVGRPVDHELLETLVRRRIITTIQRVRLAAKLRARPSARAAWIAANGLERLMGFAEGLGLAAARAEAANAARSSHEAPA